MADFRFIKDNRGRWIVSAPKRAKRPDQSKGVEPPCPFDPGHEDPIFSLNQVRVVPNKFPFAPIHEIVIHSDDHHKNFDELSLSQNEDIFTVYQSRFLEHKSKGQVFIFHNNGKNAGESLPHPHTQLVVLPKEVEPDTPALRLAHEEIKEMPYFKIFCPNNSQWPDEVWVAPRKDGRFFYEIEQNELKEISFIVGRLVQIFSLRHGHEFPFNFYIYPKDNWYLRLIPRVKMIGGFEVGAGIFVNTGNPSETFEFIKEHFDNPDHEKIKNQHYASYKRSV